MTKNTNYSMDSIARIDTSMLDVRENDMPGAYEIKVKIPEFTFLDESGNTNYGNIYLTVYPMKYVIDLRSLKKYVFQWRNLKVERNEVVSKMYQDFVEAYQADRLRLFIDCTSMVEGRAKLLIDSDWKERGGAQKYGDWQKQGAQDIWEVRM